MNGKVVVVTGSNVGIGMETAVGVAALGATTVLACRNEQSAEAAAEEVRQRTGHDDVHVVRLDLGDLASVRECAAAIQERWSRVDVLINNAGGLWNRRGTTAQGFEQTFGVNHLGPFYLTSLLADRLVASAPARVINVTSAGHHFATGGMRWNDLQSARRYKGMQAYVQSKLANLLFTRGLAARYDPAQLTANAVHPGTVRTRLGLDGDLKGVVGIGPRLTRPFFITARAGARTSIFLATDPSVAGATGEYWVRRHPGHMSRAARDDDAGERLWSESERMLSAAAFPCQLPGRS